MMDPVRFHKPDEPGGYLSNWYPSPFTLGGKRYSCAEQYMMERKAALFGDESRAAAIMATDSPEEMQRIARDVKPFVPKIWDGRKQPVVLRAVLAKFRQNPGLREKLLATGDALLVECAYKDKTWGAGLHMYDPLPENPAEWPGKNLLGFTLMAAREILREEE